jgi:hypothetical protein
LNDTDASTNVTKADGKVDVVLCLLYDSPATIGLDPVAVAKPDALQGIIQMGMNKHRPHLLLKGQLAETGGPVGRADRSEGGDGKDESAPGRRY